MNLVKWLTFGKENALNSGGRYGCSTTGFKRYSRVDYHRWVSKDKYTNEV